MENFLGICIPYLDDVIIFSSTFEEHLSNFHNFLKRLWEHGVKLKPQKCKLMRKKKSISCEELFQKENTNLIPKVLSQSQASKN